MEYSAGCRRVPHGLTHTARYPYGSRLTLTLSGARTGTGRDGIPSGTRLYPADKNRRLPAGFQTGKTHTARYPYGPRLILKLSGTRPGTVRGGLSHLGPVCIPPTKTAGYLPGIPHGPHEVCHMGTELEPSGCFGWEESKIGGRVRLDRLGDLQRTCPQYY